MTSKEALKTIFINCKDLLVDKNGNVVKLEDLIKTIKQALERLEVLEKKNQELYEKVNHLKNVKNRWRRNCNFLEKENEYLKNANEEYQQGNYELSMVYAKLKQKLEEIKSFSYSMPPYYYDIIKEMIGNE